MWFPCKEWCTVERCLRNPTPDIWTWTFESLMLCYCKQSWDSARWVFVFVATNQWNRCLLVFFFPVLFWTENLGCVLVASSGFCFLNEVCVLLLTNWGNHFHISWWRDHYQIKLKPHTSCLCFVRSVKNSNRIIQSCMFHCHLKTCSLI